MSDFEALVKYADGNHTADERAIIEDYKKCLGEGNTDGVDFYAQFGPTIRHRIMNMNSYLHNLQFGFTHKDLDEHNWLKREKFEVEIIEFETNIDKNNPYIELGKSPNGKWSFGWSYSTGGNGSGCSVCVFTSPINTRKECFDIAITHAQKWFADCLNRNNSTNYNETLINQVLKSIDKIKCDSNQLALF